MNERASVAALRETDGARTDDRLTSAVEAKIVELRDLELEKSKLEERLRDVNIAINDMLWSKLPTMMDEARVDSMGIPGRGNEPPYNVKLDTHYKANIPPEHVAEAYAFLRKQNAHDLIKTQYTVSFGLGEAKAAKKFEDVLRKAKVDFEVKQGVPWNTLTAWFKNEYKRRPSLFKVRAREILGATVGRVAIVVKAKKERT